MLTNDIKSGAKIVLRNGWKATVKDNKKGNIRVCEVEGYFTEIGSTYVWDWKYLVNDKGEHIPITLTGKQSNDRKKVQAFF
jgi:hypothetical protein